MSLSTASIFEDVRLLDRKIEEQNQTRTELLQKAAEQTCPYTVGQIVVTNSGLGTNGLSVTGIGIPLNPRYPDNTWKIETFALSKDGTVTRRYVGIEHAAADTFELKAK